MAIGARPYLDRRHTSLELLFHSGDSDRDLPDTIKKDGLLYRHRPMRLGPGRRCYVAERGGITHVLVVAPEPRRPEERDAA